jgi:peptidoglycan/LPS O-acetylase OafA/YrhL
MSSTEPAVPLGPGRPEDIPALTSVRFFAAVGVVLFHYGAPIEAWLRGLGAGTPLAAAVARVVAAPLTLAVKSGFLGVSLFFVLSGFILTHVYLTRDPGHVDRRRFWSARFARIYPVYLIGFLGCAPLIVVGSLDRWGSGGAAAHVLLGAVPALLLVHGWICAWVPLWNFPSWSVGVEAFFYLLFPWLAPALARVRARRRLAAGAVIWIAGMALPLGYIFGSQLAASGIAPIVSAVASWSDPDGWRRLVTNVPIFHVHEFLLGILVARAYVDRDPGRAHGDRWTVCGCLLTALLLAAGHTLPTILESDGLLAPAFACVIYGLACGGRLASWLSHPTLVILGEASYALYVLQSPVFDLTSVGFMSARPDLEATDGGRAVIAGVIILTMLMAAILVSRGVEQPARRRILGWFSRPSGAPGRTPAPATP